MEGDFALKMAYVTLFDPFCPKKAKFFVFWPKFSKSVLDAPQSMKKSVCNLNLDVTNGLVWSEMRGDHCMVEKYVKSGFYPRKSMKTGF